MLRPNTLCGLSDARLSKRFQYLRQALLFDSTSAATWAPLLEPYVA